MWKMRENKWLALSVKVCDAFWGEDALIEMDQPHLHRKHDRAISSGLDVSIPGGEVLPLAVR